MCPSEDSKEENLCGLTRPQGLVNLKEGQKYTSKIGLSRLQGSVNLKEGQEKTSKTGTNHHREQTSAPIDH